MKGKNTFWSSELFYHLYWQLYTWIAFDSLEQLRTRETFLMQMVINFGPSHSVKAIVYAKNNRLNNLQNHSSDFSRTFFGHFNPRWFFSPLQFKADIEFQWSSSYLSCCFSRQIMLEEGDQTGTFKFNHISWQVTYFLLSCRMERDSLTFNSICHQVTTS